MEILFYKKHKFNIAYYQPCNYQCRECWVITKTKNPPFRGQGKGINTTCLGGIFEVSYCRETETILGGKCQIIIFPKKE